MRKLLRPIFIATLFLIAASASRPVFAQTAIGEVENVTGSVQIERAGQMLDVVPSMPIQVHDKFATSAKGKLTVHFHDGSKLVLSESGAFSIDEYTITSDSRVVANIALWANHLRAIVNVGRGGVPNFEVHTPNAVAAVRGTEFETAYIANRPCPEDRSCMRYTTVEVFTGSVTVANSSDRTQSVQVNDGYETTVACEAPATAPAPLGMEEMGSPGYH
jgi:hypothetical protein